MFSNPLDKISPMFLSATFLSSLLDVTADNLCIDMLLDSDDLHDYTDTDKNLSELHQEVNISNHPIVTQTRSEARVQNDENSKPNITVLGSDTAENQVTVEEKTYHYQASLEKTSITRILEKKYPHSFQEHFVLAFFR
ncbi:hypothetical protein JTB14_000385 [Gonioctena quinquepunctata]|nr:hypothetical protein JTB14_000385 [Gonioctena quinquepunctata]